LNSYWLDSDVLVFAKDNVAPFGFEEYAGFWKLIERNIENGTVKITKRNHQEITENRDTDDELAIWLKSVRGEGVRVPPNKDVQKFAAKIADYVWNNEQYYVRHKTRFSRGADAWLIAQASIDEGFVVTREISQPECHAPKIPDLCKEFDVKQINLIDLMKTLGKPPSSTGKKK
jgi:Domain of unknown function (DUF4411)